jgi:hypothetical protein
MGVRASARSRSNPGLNFSRKFDESRILSKVVEVGISFEPVKAAINMASTANSMGQPERGLQPLRDLCANLPEGFDAPQRGEAQRLLSP